MSKVCISSKMDRIIRLLEMLVFRHARSCSSCAKKLPSFSGVQRSLIDVELIVTFIPLDPAYEGRDDSRP